ncbi:MAG: prolyl aminopeptidase [Micavibrio sp.]|nr:prolyl aminopeptidase [Micavibrio sp.]|tara:strand:- start:266 stop:1207 length:942 start_codon:yes stop_codon:yes gene_type:complete
MDLFPEIVPYSSGYLPVENPHEIYWEQSGNPDGTPVVVLHGGPGGGTSPVNRQFFDPDHYRIILFDQRGAGKSTPPVCLINNTTQHLVQDIEALREHLGIEKWHVFGGSWGSTLALSYAAKHADKIKSMVLRGIFLMEEQEIDWLLYGLKTIYPESWEQFVSIIPENEHDDLLNAYHKRLNSDDPEIRMEAAMSWSLYESACSSLIPNYEIITTDEQRAQALAIATIEVHYFYNQLIKTEDSLLNQVNAFRSIPTMIVQGRYDMICPIATAHKLHTNWPEADYIVVPDGGHSALDPPVRSRLIEATENMKSIS